MTKRAHSPDSSARPSKKLRVARPSQPCRVATAEAAASMDADPPLGRLMRARVVGNPGKGKAVIYWMRMGDLRIRDNKALNHASAQAQKDGIPLMVLFILSPQDYQAHARGARRIDFMLRNLKFLQTSLADLDIPLLIIEETERNVIPSRLLSVCEKYAVRALFANMEYEVDELQRDISVCELAFSKGVRVVFEHDKCIIEPGVVLTKQGKAYTVYSPYQRNWLSVLNSDIARYVEEYPPPTANEKCVRSLKLFSDIFESETPRSVDGFELAENDKVKMEEVWPEGEVAAAEVLDRFLSTKKRSSQLGATNPLSAGSEKCSKSSRIAKYASDRDQLDTDTTSRLSPYLSSGVISSRECARAAMRLKKASKVDGDRSSGIGRWMQEIAWRDFYVNILAAFPRVCMGRPYLEKFSAVAWENPQRVGSGPADLQEDAESVQRWKRGMTGVPIVDAAMRCIDTMGWVHNRARMITAMYLCKHLMIDWRVGEKYFMETLIDGDFASNNGGWQWCASTGVDPCPYFRIFNPYSQSVKADPNGDFIRHWVPELRGVRGSDLHNPSPALADKMGYPRPIIAHSEALERALRRYKNPGDL